MKYVIRALWAFITYTLWLLAQLGCVVWHLNFKHLQSYDDFYLTDDSSKYQDIDDYLAERLRDGSIGS